MYYVFINNNKIDGRGQAKCLNDDILSVEVEKEVYDDIERYIWNGSEIVLNPDYDSEQLQKAKEEKYNEALLGAAEYISSGQALYELDENKHIEATDGNIAKFSAYALGYVTGSITGNVEWSTKEDEVIELNQEQVGTILLGLGAIQQNVWTVKFPAYVTEINEAQTIEEVEAIEINYGGVQAS